MLSPMLTIHVKLDGVAVGAGRIAYGAGVVADVLPGDLVHDEDRLSLEADEAPQLVLGSDLPPVVVPSEGHRQRPSLERAHEVYLFTQVQVRVHVHLVHLGSFCTTPKKRRLDIVT